MYQVAMAVILLSVVSCGNKSSDDTAAATADSPEYTALKTIMVEKCAGSGCHSSAGVKSATWYSSETAFKANLTSIQSQVSSGTMPKSGSGFILSADEKAKFAAYK